MWEGSHDRDCPTWCSRRCLHGDRWQAALSAHQPRPICCIRHRWQLTADWVSDIRVQRHWRAVGLAALLPRRPWAVHQDGLHQSDTVQFDVGVPQRPVLGPLLFVVYCSPAADVISRHGIKYQQYADDMQLCICRCEPTSPPRGSPFSPRLLLTSSIGTWRTACSLTPTSRRCWLSGCPPRCKPLH